MELWQGSLCGGCGMAPGGFFREAMSHGQSRWQNGISSLQLETILEAPNMAETSGNPTSHFYG